MNEHPPLDRAEMQARGYDPSTIAEAESQRAFRALELCETIREAFAGVKLGCGVGLREAQGLDDYEDGATCAAYREGDEKDDWQRIPVKALNACHSSLSFFDAAGMRFHLPAYLIADLRGEYHFGMAFALSNLIDNPQADLPIHQWKLLAQPVGAPVSDYKRKQFSLLSDAQRSAVRQFLLHIVEDSNYAFYRPDILWSLAEYWL